MLLGIDGDEQADLSVHGGLEKAVYGYSSDNYGAWQIEYPQHTAMLEPESLYRAQRQELNDGSVT
jgi:MOSC domain-containing protein YiiM